MLGRQYRSAEEVAVVVVVVVAYRFKETSN